MRKTVINKMKDRGIDLERIAEIVYNLQKSYYPGLTNKECLEAVKAVLDKREVQFAVLTGLALDEVAEKELLPEPILSIIKDDEPLYGVDEILAMAITNIYGTIGITSFGYLDKMKIGLVGELDSNKNGKVNTFSDDIVAAIASAAAAKIAHSQREEKYK